MAIPQSFLKLLADPAPGFHFPRHDGAKVDEYVQPAPHFTGPPAKPEHLALLDQHFADAPHVAEQFKAIYRVHDGIQLFTLPDPANDSVEPALQLLPLQGWHEATAEYLHPDMICIFDGVEDVYVPGKFHMFAGNASEGTRLVVFSGGEYEGEPLAGRITCIAMDPVLSALDFVAHHVDELLETIARDPIDFLESIGFCHYVQTAGGSWGAVPDQYLPDIRGMTNLRI